jgi:hypothetical protein
MQVLKPAEKHADQDMPGNTMNTVEASGLELRIAELETRLGDISRAMDEFHDDVRSIKYRLAYSASGTAIVLGLLGWIANSRFDQVISLIVAH